MATLILLGFILLDMHLRSAGKLFQLGQEVLSNHRHHLLQVFGSLPQSNEQRRQVFLIQSQEEIHIPVRLQQLQKLFHNFCFCQIIHMLVPI